MARSGIRSQLTVSPNASLIRAPFMYTATPWGEPSTGDASGSPVTTGGGAAMNACRGERRRRSARPTTITAAAIAMPIVQCARLITVSRAFCSHSPREARFDDDESLMRSTPIGKRRVCLAVQASR